MLILSNVSYICHDNATDPQYDGCRFESGLNICVDVNHMLKCLCWLDFCLFSSSKKKAAAEDEVNGSGDAEAASLLKGMASRASRVESEITRRLRLEFASLVKPVQAPTGGSVAGLVGAKEGGVTGGEGTRERKRQALLSCLRPFSALGSGIEAEKQFAR